MPLKLTPQLQVSERYIENTIDHTRAEEYISSGAASLNLDYEPALFHLKGDYSFGPTIYSRDPSLNNINQQGSIAISEERPLWSTNIKGTIVSTKLTDLVSQYNNGIIIQGSQYLQEGVGFDSKFIMTRRSAILFNFDYLKSDYNSTQLINSETDTAGSSLSFDMNEKNHVTLSGGASLFRYQSGESRKSVNAKVQWNHQFGRFTSFQAGTGMGVASGYFRFWLADLNLARNTEKGNLQAGYSRSLNAGGGITSIPVLSQQVNATVSRQLMEKLNGSLSGTLGESFEYQPGMDYHSRFWSSSLNLTYELFKWLNAALSIAHYDQQLEGRILQTLQSNQMMLTLSSNFPSWRPF